MLARTVAMFTLYHILLFLQIYVFEFCLDISAKLDFYEFGSGGLAGFDNDRSFWHVKMVC